MPKPLWWLPMMLLGIVGVAPLVLLHSGACAMHATAVEQLWAHQPDRRSKYVWSHAYCSVVSAPWHLIFGDA